MSEPYHLDYYDLFLEESEEPEQLDEFVGEFISFLKEQDFRFIRKELEEKCYEALEPISSLLTFDVEDITRTLLSDVLEDEESFVGISTEKGILVMKRMVRTQLASAKGDTRNIRRIRSLELTHARTEHQEKLNQSCEGFLKDKKATLVSEEKSIMSENLDKRLANLSPSGKILSKEENKKKARALLDPRMWAVISSINEEEGGVAYSKHIKAIGKKLKLKKEDLDSLISSLQKQKLVHKLLQIVCSRCGAPNVRIDASTDIATLLKSIKCGVCNGELNQSDVIEVFVLPQDVVRLVNGLWLEEYVAEIVGSECSRVWQGRFLGNDELDVVGLKLGSVFLFECKTTQIGHTDVYNLVIKARRLGADASFIVTTEKVVENARKAIEELSLTEGMDIYTVEGSPDSIRKGIVEYLKKEINKRLRTLVFQAMGVPTHRYVPRTFRRVRYVRTY